MRRTRTVKNAVAVTKKYRNFGLFLECKSGRQSSASGVKHPKEKKGESEKETNPPFIFSTTHAYLKKYV